MRKVGTLKEALDYLAKVVDNAIDPFTAMQELVKFQWQPGQDIGDYFFTAKRKAVPSGITLKFVAALVSSQLPKEAQNRVKGTVTDINESLDHAEAFKFIAEVKEVLIEKGFALNLGSRIASSCGRVANISENRDIS